MTSRAQAADATRLRLLEAGLEVAEREGLAGMSVNLLVEQAGVSKGTFFHHFGDRAAYLVQLHRAFHDELIGRLRHALDDQPRGVDRLNRAAGGYLDECLRRRGVRALLLDARAEASIRSEIAARNDATARLVEPDFRAAGVPRPRITARLWVGLVAEVAIMELGAGRRLRDARAALEHLVRSAAG